MALRVRFLLLWLGLSIPFFAFGKADTVKVVGDYKVSSMTKMESGSFDVRFEKKEPSGHMDLLRLVTPHVHVGLKVGEVLKISAEVMANPRSKQKLPVAQISQVLVFLKSSHQTTIPVWLISEAHGARPLKGAKYLEMHAPTSDFLVL